VLQVLQERDGTISIKELSDITAIKTDDIISTLQHLNLIQYQKGQHVICAAPSVIERHLKAAGSPGLQVIACLQLAASLLCSVASLSAFIQRSVARFLCK
jgi:histone acetyltransferase MYST1